MRRSRFEEHLSTPRPTRPGWTGFSSNLPEVFETCPAMVAQRDRTLVAWLQCRTGMNSAGGPAMPGTDVVVAKWLDAGAEQPVSLSATDATAGPPQLCIGSGGIVCLWECCRDGRWSIEGKRLVEGEWSDIAAPATPAHQFAPALATAADGHPWGAWVELDGQERSLKLIDLDDPHTQPLDVPTTGRACYRPRLALAGETLWLTWESHGQGTYRVCAAPVSDLARAEMVSDGPGWDLLHTSRGDASGRLWLAWVQSQDVEDEHGVVDQWQSIETVCHDGEWRRQPRVADLCQGLLPKTNVWGYCGRRRHPMLVANGEGMWVLWERKHPHDGSTLVATGALCGRCADAGQWSPERKLHDGLLYYFVDGHTSDGRVRLIARDLEGEAAWDSGVVNVFEPVWANLLTCKINLSQDSPEYQVDQWTGWQPVAWSEKRQQRPRFDVDGLHLYWGDPHCHSGQSGDAEGEVDELLRYAREKAKLDFCAVADNDVYCFPLTDHEWARQRRLIGEHSVPGEFVVVPLYEWSWADPVTNVPNHRLVAFPKPEAPLWRHCDPEGKDIDTLAGHVAAAGGLLIGHHLGWVFADSPAETAIEICSAWHPHMLEKPEFIHDTLRAGRRLGFTGGSDSHRRNPGMCGALTGIYAAELKSEALVDAIRKRRTVATTGTMIAMDFRVGDALIGDDVQAAGPLPITVRVRSPRPIESVAVVRDGEVIHGLGAVNASEAALDFTDAPPPGQHWYYARAKLVGDVPKFGSNVVVAEGGHGWTSPIWVRGSAR